MSDEEYMHYALALAKKGNQYAAPNPMVGAVIVYNNVIIGQGYHQKHGEAHAEVNAVNSVKDKSVLSQATIYVTLEPCAHTGKTPPCADLIVKHNFKRCVIGCLDTFSEVSGKGIERLKKAGVEVEVGLLENECRALNKRFFTYHEKKRPFVILKWAQTLDGFIDREEQERKPGINWITQPETKQLVHQWRSEEQAILVGWKTIVNDNPSLTVREVKGKNPHRYVVDPDFKSKGDFKVYTDGLPTTVFVKSNTLVPTLPHTVFVPLSSFNVREMLMVIYENEKTSVFVEGGKYTLKRFIEYNLWDEARILTGNIRFGTGVKAPKISGEKEIIEPTSTADQLTRIKNK